MRESVKHLWPKIFPLEAFFHCGIGQVPGYPQPVGSVGVQGAGGLLAIKIDPVAVGNHAKPREVQVSVAAAQRIEGPGHGFNSQGKRPQTLRYFQLVANALALIGKTHR